jgi:hypothetical protein
MPATLMLNVSTSSPIFEHLKINTKEEVTPEDGIDWSNKLVMADLRRKRVIAKRNQKARQDESRKQEIMEGDLVFIKQYNISSLLDQKIKKWFQLYRGPYVCVRRIKDNVVELVDPLTNKSIGLQSVARCKLWHPSDSVKAMWADMVRRNMSAGEKENCSNEASEQNQVIVHCASRDKCEKLGWNDQSEASDACNLLLQDFIESTHDTSVVNYVRLGYLDPITAKLLFHNFV